MVTTLMASLPFMCSVVRLLFLVSLPLTDGKPPPPGLSDLGGEGGAAAGGAWRLEVLARAL